MTHRSDSVHRARTTPPTSVTAPTEEDAVSVPLRSRRSLVAAHYDVMFSPHNYMSPLATLINAHLCASMPTCEILEIDMDDVPWKWDLIDQPLDIRDGQLHVPDRPGWGANVVEDVVAAHPLGGHARPEFLSPLD
jgi:hypothetical protein